MNEWINQSTNQLTNRPINQSQSFNLSINLIFQICTARWWYHATVVAISGQMKQTPTNVTVKTVSSWNPIVTTRNPIVTTKTLFPVMARLVVPQTSYSWYNTVLFKHDGIIAHSARCLQEESLHKFLDSQYGRAILSILEQSDRVLTRTHPITRSYPINRRVHMDAYSVLWLLMAWWRSTRPPVSSVLTKYSMNWISFVQTVSFIFYKIKKCYHIQELNTQKSKG